MKKASHICICLSTQAKYNNINPRRTFNIMTYVSVRSKWWKQLKCPADGYTKCSIFVQWDIIPPSTGRKFVKRATTWWNLEDSILSEISQTRKDK